MRKLILHIILFLIASYVYAQGGSLKSGYGYHSTAFFYEDDVYKGKKLNRNIDTLLKNDHLWEYLSASTDEAFLDLGNIGTAIRPIHLNFTGDAGQNFGAELYNFYNFNPEDVRYFNTKSPYSLLHYVQGSQGQQVFRFAHNRNIKPNWNVGIDINRISANYLVGTEDDSNHTNIYSFIAQTSFFSKDSLFKVLFHYNHFNNMVDETGGAILDSGETKSTLFDPFSTINTLNTIKVVDSRNNFHMYYEYKLGKNIKLFDRLDRERRFLRFVDSDVDDNLDYYPAYNGDSTTIDHKMKFSQWKANGGISFYTQGARIDLFHDSRLFHYSNLDDNNSDWQLQHFGGGSIFLESGDYNFEGTAKVGTRNSRLVEARFNIKGLDASFHYSESPPTLIQSRYTNEVFNWDNSFDNPGVIEVKGKYKWRKGNFDLRPNFNYSLLTNYIYFNESALPEQNQSSIDIVQAGLWGKFESRRFILQDNLKSTTASNSIIRIPGLYNHFQAAWKSRLYKSEFQLGVDLYYRSSYEPNGFMPITQQFTLQSGFTADSYLVSDVFFNIRLKKARVFLKMNHLNQGFMGADGYFIAPNYIGLTRTFVFGVNWEFFD